MIRMRTLKFQMTLCGDQTLQKNASLAEAFFLLTFEIKTAVSAQSDLILNTLILNLIKRIESFAISIKLKSLFVFYSDKPLQNHMIVVYNRVSTALTY